MTKELFSIHIADVSAFAQSLGRALRERHAVKPTPPGQVELLNLIARAKGQRNWQALRLGARADASAGHSHAWPRVAARLSEQVPGHQPASPLTENARKALAHFDHEGRLMRWPVKYSVQKLVMWALWTRFDAKRVYTESEVNTILKSANLFSDHATLRRELIGHRLMERKSDCSEYRKLQARPDEEARLLLTAWRERSREG